MSLLNSKLTQSTEQNIKNYEKLNDFINVFDEYKFNGKHFLDNKRYSEEKDILNHVQKITYDKSFDIKNGDDNFKYDNSEENIKRKNIANVLSINDKPNTFLDYDRFKYTFRDYLLDILGITDANIIGLINNLIKKMPPIDTKRRNKIGKKNYRGMSDDLIVYYIYYLIEKINEANPITPEGKSLIVMKFIYVILFHGIDSITVEEYDNILNNHDNLKTAFTDYFRNNGELTPGIPKDDMQLTCKQFVNEYLCGNNKGIKYGKRTQMYRLLTGMQSCIYDNFDNIEELMNKTRKCDGDDKEVDVEPSNKINLYDYILSKRGCNNFDDKDSKTSLTQDYGNLKKFRYMDPNLINSVKLSPPIK